MELHQVQTAHPPLRELAAAHQQRGTVLQEVLEGYRDRGEESVTGEQVMPGSWGYLHTRRIPGILGVSNPSKEIISQIEGLIKSLARSGHLVKILPAMSRVPRKVASHSPGGSLTRPLVQPGGNHGRACTDPRRHSLRVLDCR